MCRVWLLLGALGAGCSTGLEPDDTATTDTADTGDTDTGDTDPGDTDSGPVDTDSGPVDTDSGPVDTDSGSTGCADDAGEPDDTLQEATALTTAGSASGQICAGDSDWYAVPVGAGCVVDLHLDFAVAEGDLDVWLYDADGVAVGYSLGSTDDEVVSYVHGGTAGTFYVEVQGYDDSEAAYALSVTSTCDAAPACPADDPFEANDTLETASPLNGFHTDLLGVACTGDDDWYAVPFVPYGCRLDASLDFDPLAADLDLYVYDPLEVLAGTSASGDDVEATTWYADVEGPVYVLVRGYDGDSGAYTLTTDLVCPDYDAPACPDDDWFEENDADFEGALLNDGYTFVDAAMCDEVDRYWAVVPSGCFYQARVDFDAQALDVDLDLYDYGTDEVLTGSYGTSGTEWVSWIADGDVLGEIGVWRYSGAGPYTLEAVLVCPDGQPLACPGDDVFEDNETVSMPLNDTVTFLEAIACEDDSDFYAAWVGEGCTFTADLVQGDTGDLDLYLYDGSTEVDTSLNDPPAAESVSFTAATARWVDLEVYPYEGSSPYLLETAVTCP